MTEERDNIIILFDENGKEVEFEYLGTVESDKKEYLVLSPLDAEDHDNGDLSDENDNDKDAGKTYNADADADAEEDEDDYAEELAEEESDDEELREVVIFRITHGSDGEDSYEYVDDDDEMEAVFEEFKAKMDDEYDFL